MTKREMFARIAEINASDAEIVDFCNHEIQLLDSRKTPKTPSKKDVENAGLIEIIRNALGIFPDGVTVSELMKTSDDLNGLSNQKVSALLRKMKGAGEVEKIEEGKKSLFRLV